jgi:hypothetical protein
MVPGLHLLEEVGAIDLVGVLLVLWVAVLATLSTSGVDPAAPPLWWGVVVLLLTVASVLVALVLYRQTRAEGEELGTVWEAVPEWEYDGGHGAVNGTAQREQEESLREGENGRRNP